VSEKGNGIEARGKRIYDRFVNLINPPKEEPAEQPRVPTKEEKLAAELASWVDDAPPIFWRALDRLVIEAHTSAREDISTHAAVTYGLGYEAGMEKIRELFKSWRSQAEKEG
jgi:hypothetical protein